MRVMKVTPAERLERRLVLTSRGCLEWTGEIPFAASAVVHGLGYGLILFNGKKIGTHRLAWILAHGPIPPGLFVCHHCDNPPCCQTEPTVGYPDGHLFLGTHADNAADMAAKGRSAGQKVTHCPQGHAYSESNTYVDPSGKRRCRQCRSDEWVRKALGRGNSQKIVCPQKHPYDEANTYVDLQGRRHCRLCAHLADERWRAKGLRRKV